LVTTQLAHKFIVILPGPQVSKSEVDKKL